MLLGIDHIEIIVRDVDESVDFYQKLGFVVLMRTTHHGGSAELQLPGDNQPVIEIHKVSGEENIGVNHIAFKVDSAAGAYRTYKIKGLRRSENLITSNPQDELTSTFGTPTAGASSWWMPSERHPKRCKLADRL